MSPVYYVLIPFTVVVERNVQEVSLSSQEPLRNLL